MSQRKRRRLGRSTQGTQRRRAEPLNEVGSYDFVYDQTEDWQPPLKWLPICDEFSRELVALEVNGASEAKYLIRILDAAIVDGAVRL